MIAATIAIIEEEGAAALSVRAAAKRAGVSPGAPFRHFASRKALLTAVAEEATEALQRDVAAAVAKARAKPPAARLKAIASAYLTWALANPARFDIVSNRRLIDYEESPTLRARNDDTRALLDGAIAAVVSGGTGPYVLSWNGPGGFTSGNANINGLYAGNYTLNVTDAHGCSASAGQVLLEAAQLDANISATTGVTCFGDGLGSATVTGSGGVPPYSYAWNSAPVQNAATASTLAAGSYVATVTDAYNCTASATATITGPTAALNTAHATDGILIHVTGREAKPVSFLQWVRISFTIRWACQQYLSFLVRR